MAQLVTIIDMATHIYDEYMEEISRDNDAIVQAAIDRAIAQAKGYCSRFALLPLFGNPAKDPTFVDPQLKGIVKDLALWHLLQLSNPNIEMNRAQAAYEYAVSWLKDLQRGQVMPEGWTYHDTTTDSKPAEGNAVEYSSLPKRRNHY
ncbi:MAG: DUF1320 family protein [Bacteroidetes bacterium]|nr:DUF1320 family protein [Bacteroidota bacterium]